MKLRRSKALTVVLSMLFAAWTAMACVGGKVFDEYEQIPVEGWDKTDTLTFSVPAVAADGVYNLALGLRTTGDYPFMSLTLLFEANIIAKKSERSLARAGCQPLSIQFPRCHDFPARRRFAASEHSPQHETRNAARTERFGAEHHPKSSLTNRLESILFLKNQTSCPI